MIRANQPTNIPRLGTYLLPVALVVIVSLQLFPSNSNQVVAQSVREAYALAAGAYERNQWIESAEAFESLINNHPDSPQARESFFFLGESLMQQSKFEKAYVAYQNFLLRSPNHKFAERATFRSAESAYRKHNSDLAAKLLESFVVTYSQSPLNEYALTYLGETRLNRGEPQLAQRAYETCLKMFPNSSFADQCGIGLARALHMQGNEIQAVEIYRTIVDQPKSTMIGQAKLQLGILAYSYDQIADARKWLGEALTECGDETKQGEAAYWLARAELKSNNPSRAVTLFELASEKTNNPRLLESIYYDGAIASISSSNFENATAWLDRIRNGYPTGNWADDALSMKVDIAFRQKHYESALDMVKQFNDEYPDSPLGLKVNEIAGRIHFANKDFTQCAKTFERLIEQSIATDDDSLVPQRANWNYLSSLAHIGLNNLDLAEANLNSIDMENASSDLQRLASITRASCRFGLEKYAESISDYRRYLKLDPNGEQAPRARSELTIALAKTGNWDLAARAFDNMLETDEGQNQVVTTAQYISEHAYQADQKEFAMKCYEVMARSGNPKTMIAQGLSGMAWVEMESDNKNQALAVFQRIINEHPDTKFAAEAAMARAKFLDKSRDYKQATEMYDMVVRKLGHTKLANIARLRLANDLQVLGGKEQLRRAKNLLTEYLQSPGEKHAEDEAIYQLAWVYHDLNLAPHGRKRFETIVKKYPDSKYWEDAAYRLAEHHVQQKEFQLAKPLLNQLIQRETNQKVASRVLYLHGQVAAASNDWSAVAVSMEKLAATSNDQRMQAKAKYWMAESAYQQDQFDQANLLFEELRSGVPGLEQNLKPWIWLRSMQCAGQMNDWNTARELAERAQNLFPNFESGFEFEYIRGRAFADSGRLNDAIDSFAKVAASGKTETAAIAQWRIGEAYFHQEKYANAIEAYYRVDSLFDYPKWRAASLMQAGKCQEHLGNWKHAAKLYQQLIEKFPETRYAPDAKQRLTIAMRQAQRILDAKNKR